MSCRAGGSEFYITGYEGVEKAEVVAMTPDEQWYIYNSGVCGGKNPRQTPAF